MIIVSDTSPLTALLTVGQADLLTKLFRDVVVPEAVRDELLHSHSVLQWSRRSQVRTCQLQPLTRAKAETEV